MHPSIACVIAAAPLRAETTDRSEMVSQLLFGETAQVIKEKEKWYRIRTIADQYEGWIEKKLVLPAQQPTSRHIVTHPVTLMDDLDQVYRLSPGAVLPSDQKQFDFAERKFTRNEDLTRPSSTLSFAMNYLGTPYLWGGRSLYGVDCSGFSQMIARYNGMEIPRDAYQQAEKGTIVNFLAEAQTGDLAFFDNPEGKIIHVGMVINEGDHCQIIHASGHVRIDALDHQGIFRKDEKAYTHSLRIIKRLFN
jgi:gamma-D-glutamyl-L-lysine dipeptidyl-peptidase